MVTMECKAPCPYGIGAPSGKHYHHFHNKSNPDCIIDEVKHKKIMTNYTFTEEEYQRLCALAKEKGLPENLIKFLEHNYKGAHNCHYEIEKKGRMNAIAGMCWDIAIENYGKTAKLIEETTKENCEALFGKPGDVMVDFVSLDE